MKVKLEIVLPKDISWYSDKVEVREIFEKSFEANKEQLTNCDEVEIYYITSGVDLFAESVATTQLSAIKKYFLLDRTKKVVVYADKKIIMSFKMAKSMKSNSDIKLFNKYVSYIEV